MSDQPEPQRKRKGLQKQSLRVAVWGWKRRYQEIAIQHRQVRRTRFMNANVLIGVMYLERLAMPVAVNFRSKRSSNG